MLPDLLKPGLRLVICGTAPGTVSAKRRAYYAHSGNRFWTIMQEIGLTAGLVRPEDYGRLSDDGIGFTDLAKQVAGMDRALPAGCYDVERLRRAIRANQPRALAFNGKKAASQFYMRRTVTLAYGRRPELVGDTAVCVLPSTSGAAGRYWSIEPWQSMARELLAPRQRDKTRDMA